jgi:acetyl-CoA carboxylase carboxyltransferase component
VPHLSLMMGASYGAGNYGMCGRAFDPRFLYAWPNSRTAVMGPTQLAGVLSIVAREGAEASGVAFDEVRDAERTAQIADQIERESFSFFMSGKVYDDGVFDPADTRTILGISLSACHSNVVQGRRGFGVFRM